MAKTKEIARHFILFRVHADRGLVSNDKTSEQVASKIMVPEAATDDEAVGELLREIRTTQALTSPMLGWRIG